MDSLDEWRNIQTLTLAATLCGSLDSAAAFGLGFLLEAATHCFFSACRFSPCIHSRISNYYWNSFFNLFNNNSVYVYRRWALVVGWVDLWSSSGVLIIEPRPLVVVAAGSFWIQLGLVVQIHRIFIFFRDDFRVHQASLD